MALGAGCINNGDVYTSLGTSAWIAVCDDTPVTDTENRPYAFAHCIPGKFVSAVAIFSAGNSLRWVRDKLFTDLCKEESCGGKSAYAEIDRLAEASRICANNLFFIPTLAGGSALDKSPSAKGGFVGLDLMHTREDIARATLEGIALNLRVALDVLKSHVSVGEEMLVVGGGSKSEFWMRIFANAYNMIITKTAFGEDAGSFGAAALAAVGAGVWKDLDHVKTVLKSEVSAIPEKNAASTYASIIPTYKTLLDISSQIGEMLIK
jgi:xylulokinase